MNSTFRLIINGERREGSEGEGVDVINPATGGSVGRVAYASPADLDEALVLAAVGLREWSSAPPWERGRILKDAAARLRANCCDIAPSLTMEQGKPLSQAIDEVERSADFLEWAGEEARRLSDRVIRGRSADQRIEVQHHPVGVVAAFTPWNFPMALAAKKFAGTLGAGCSIICKPSQECPSPVLAVAQALLDAGVTPNAIAVVMGDSNMISNHLIASRHVRKISFTGSTSIGKRLAAAAGAVMKSVTMELGGHAPVMVFGDVDPEKAAEILVKAKFSNAGQICLSPSRFFVEESIRARFTEHFVKRTRELVVGNGMESGVQVGPLSNERRLEAIAGLVDDARAKGAKILTGGKRLDTRGFFYAPTVMTDVPDDAAILREEPFGPVAPILQFVNESDLIRRANTDEFGLASYIFTNDVRRQRRMTDALEYGGVSINGSLTHFPEAPLGGWKESGLEAEGGIEILDPYMVTKHVNINDRVV